MSESIKNILIYIETSGPSLEAVDKGIQLAKELNASLSFLHVVDTDILYTGKEAEDLLEQNRLRAQKFIAQIMHLYACTGQVFLEEGTPLQKIIEKSKEIKADAVVLSKYIRRKVNGKPAGYMADELVKGHGLRIVAL